MNEQTPDKHAVTSADDPFFGFDRRPDELGRPRFWRSADELNGTGPFENPKEFVWPEFAVGADEPPDAPSRRTFLKVMGASLALAGLYGCTRRPEEKIVPYVRQPEQIIPGLPLFFATAVTFGGYAKGVLVESHEGRPTKIEGNPSHPASLGATDVFMQAEVLSLYDPDRSQAVTHDGDASNWGAFFAALDAQLERKRGAGGAGMRLLTESITSPTLIAQIQNFLKQYPQAKWHQYEPVGRNNARAGAVAAFGRDVSCVYHFDRADVIVSLDSNFLLEDPGSVRYAWDFINGRRVRKASQKMNRLYVVEGTPSITGAMADSRLTVRPSQIEQIARALAQALGASGQQGLVDSAGSTWIESVAADLRPHAGRSVVLAGESQPPVVHALAHWMNQSLGNAGESVEYRAPLPGQEQDSIESLRQLTADIDAGAVSTLIMVGGNPVYNAPSDLNFAQRLQKVEFRAHLSQHNDETSYHCHWHLPESHCLEAWGDARAFDGTTTIIQPLIAPLYPTRSAIELMSALLGFPATSGYETVREYWRAHSGASDLDNFWRSCLNAGVVPDSASPAVQVTASAQPGPKVIPPASGRFEICFRPDPTIWDGRYANNAWLQELPKPLTRLTWDNAVLMNPADADEQNLVDGQVVQVRYRDGFITGPVWRLPGQPRHVLTLHLGYGRTRAGRVGGNDQERRGFNAYRLRTSDNLWIAQGAQIIVTGEHQPMACTQGHQLMHGRELIKVEPIARYEEAPRPAKKVPLTLYPEYPYNGNKWGMVIDQNACIGCNACVIACVSENNIPVVGKEEVLRGREMHWLRIDTYYGGDNVDHADGPYFQPVPCMHCEKAPCEVVCPVNATVHDDEGINNMVYNRCVGTRYCSNNCPYKVRHFNYFQYQDEKTEQLKLQRNPDVTVRSRGVMEKCTYCIQRINHGRIEAKKYDAAIADAKTEQERQRLRALAAASIEQVQTACQQACPTDAIIFGNLNDPRAPVTLMRNEPTNYTLLDELNTQPRTSYLPRFTNAPSHG